MLAVAQLRPFSETGKTESRMNPDGLGFPDHGDTRILRKMRCVQNGRVLRGHGYSDRTQVPLSRFREGAAFFAVFETSVTRLRALACPVLQDSRIY